MRQVLWLSRCLSHVLLQGMHPGRQGFCERRAIYEFASGKLVQQVVWVNPQNAIWCDQDVDMRLGYQSWTEAWLKDGKLHLVIQMGEEDLIYVWEKQKEPSL